MNNLSKGFIAGFIATIVLSILMVIKAMMGIMPELDLPKMLAGMMGSPDKPVIGWIAHFMIGVVLYGAAIAFYDSRKPGGSQVAHGLVLGIVGWLIMMIVLMPMAGMGMFGLKLGIMAPVMTLMLHLIFGAVLGWSFKPRSV